MSSKMFIHFFKYQKIMTSEKLAEFRVKGMLLDPKFDRLAVIGDKLQKKDEDKIKTLSIKFVSCSADDKNYYLTFEVAAKNLKSNKAKIYVGENEVIGSEEALTKSVEINANGKKKITVSFSKNKEQEFSTSFFEGDFEYIAEISCDGISAKTDEFSMRCAVAKNSGCKLTEPKAVIGKKLILTEEQKSKFVATIYAETWGAKNQFEPFSWIYFNLISRQGFEKGMNNSSAYKDKTYQYKKGLELYDTGKNEDVNEIKEIVENKILINKPLNPYPNWEGQGYYGDMNIRAPKTGSRRVWAYASQYFHLQNQCKVKNILVKEFKAEFKNSKGSRDITGYIYNFNEIESYFKKNPKDLPEYEIGQCKNDKLSPTQKNAIPAVYLIEPCQTNK